MGKKEYPVEVDAYMHACSEMEHWQAKRAKEGKEIGTEGSLCDGIAWLFDRIEKLESKFEIDANDVLFETCSPDGVGGFALNNKGVRLTHKPTGTVVQCSSERSQHRNRAKAWQELERILSTKPELQATNCACCGELKHTPLTKPKLIGWRTENYLWETDDIEKAREWEPHIGVLPIFEGDPDTKIVMSKLKEKNYG